MIQKQLFILLILFTHLTIQGQTWTRQLNGPNVTPWTGASLKGLDVQQTSDGNYVMTGVQSFPTGAIRDFPNLIKVDQSGATLWEKSYFSDNGNSAYFSNLSLVEMPNQNLLLGGLNFNDIYLIQTDDVGDTIWTQSYSGYCTQSGGGPCVTDRLKLRATNDGNYIVMTRSFITFGAPIDKYNTRVMKVTPTGTVLWTKDYLNAGAEDLQPTFDSGYIMAGQNNSGVPILYKVNNQGDSSWVKAYPGGISTSSYHSVVQAPDSGYVVATELQGFVGATPLLSKYDETGTNVIWSTFNLGATLGGLTGAANYVGYDDNGYFVTTGSVQKSHSTLSVMIPVAFVAKVGLNGVVHTEETFQDSFSNKGHVVRPTTDDGYIMVGEYRDQGYLVKVDSGITVLKITNLVEEAGLDINVFPNPFQEKATLTVEGGRYRTLDVHIFDALGREVQHVVSTNGKQVDVFKGDLTTGVYYFRLLGDQKVIGSGKLAIE